MTGTQLGKPRMVEEGGQVVLVAEDALAGDMSIASLRPYAIFSGDRRMWWIQCESLVDPEKKCNFDSKVRVV